MNKNVVTSPYKNSSLNIDIITNMTRNIIIAYVIMVKIIQQTIKHVDTVHKNL